MKDYSRSGARCSSILHGGLTVCHLACSALVSTESVTCCIALSPQVDSSCEQLGDPNKTNIHTLVDGYGESTSCHGQMSAKLPPQPQCSLCLGMTTAARQCWRKLHVNPLAAVCYFFSTKAGLRFSAIAILTGMREFRAVYLYVCTRTFLGASVLGILTDVVF